MPSEVEVIDFTWHGMMITVCITRNWLNTGYHHIELLGEQPLPVTTTGYRSHFMPMDQFAAFDSLEQMVRLWLDDAAKCKEWLKSQEKRRQLRLF